MTSFRNLGLAAPVLTALEGLRYRVPTPVQVACIPAMLAGEDWLVQASTGTGKRGGARPQLPLKAMVYLVAEGCGPMPPIRRHAEHRSAAKVCAYAFLSLAGLIALVTFVIEPMIFMAFDADLGGSDATTYAVNIRTQLLWWSIFAPTVAVGLGCAIAARGE